MATGKQYWGLTSGQWGLRTGTGELDSGSLVLRTGQTPTVPIAAPAGSDGNLQKGLAWDEHRFKDNEDGTVTDNLTGLVWLKTMICVEYIEGVPSGVRRTWNDALPWLSDLADGQCSLEDNSEPGDWRLPNINEMESLLDYSQTRPLPSEYFPYEDKITLLEQTTAPLLTSTMYNNSTVHTILITGISMTGTRTGENFFWPVRDKK